MDRRDFLKTSGVALGGLLGIGGGAYSSELKEFYGMLVDTTMCNGCRSCEEACAKANELLMPDLEDKNIFNEKRKTSTDAFTVVNKYKTSKGEVFVDRKSVV